MQPPAPLAEEPAASTSTPIPPSSDLVPVGDAAGAEQESKELQLARNQVTFLEDRVRYLENQNSNQLKQVERLLELSQSIDKSAERLSSVEKNTSKIRSHTSSKRLSKIIQESQKEAGAAEKESDTVNDLRRDLDTHKQNLKNDLDSFGKILEDLRGEKDKSVLKDVERLMKVPKFVEFLTEKMKAILVTPDLERTLRKTVSAQLDKKQFDSSNLSDQAKSVIKSWAKTESEANFLPFINKNLDKVFELLKPKISEAVPTPTDASFTVFITKKMFNDSLTLVQKQVLEMQSAAEVLRTILSMWCVKSIFMEIGEAATRVLDILSLWANTVTSSREEVKQAAHNLISFQQKGINCTENSGSILIFRLGYLTLSDFVTCIKPIVADPVQVILTDMVAALVDKHGVGASEIKYNLSGVERIADWEISTWSSLCLIPRDQSSAVQAAPLGLEEGEIEAGQPDEESDLERLARDLPDFYKLIPKRLFK